MSRPSRNEIVRFLEKVRISESGCHHWTAQIKPTGYGAFRKYRGPTMRAHRAAYEYFVGEIPDGMCVLHKCDVMHCVNPDHLFLGTVQENVRDMDLKGRRNSIRKLTPQGAKDALRMLSEGISQDKIGAVFGVDQTVISRLKLGKIKIYSKDKQCLPLLLR